jgi:hypothetical protein
MLALLAIGGAWLYFAIWISVMLSRKFVSPRWRGPFVGAAVAILSVAPIADELVGASQFKRLCAEHASAVQVAPSAAGRTVFIVPTDPVPVSGTAVRMVKHPVRFVDRSTHETVVTYTAISAGGGWLAQVIPIADGHPPLTFRGSCYPPDPPGSVSTFKRYGITYIEPPG